MSSDIDIHNSISGVESFPPESHIGATLLGAIIDTNGYYSLDFVTDIGVIDVNPSTYTPRMTHGDDPALADGTFVDAEDIIGDIAAATFSHGDTGKITRLGYAGKKRYVRYEFTVTGVSPTATFCTIGVEGNHRHQPSPQNGV